MRQTFLKITKLLHLIELHFLSVCIKLQFHGNFNNLGQWWSRI